MPTRSQLMIGLAAGVGGIAPNLVHLGQIFKLKYNALNDLKRGFGDFDRRSYDAELRPSAAPGK